jgi:hypothetical protein
MCVLNGSATRIGWLFASDLLALTERNTHPTLTISNNSSSIYLIGMNNYEIMSFPALMLTVAVFIAAACFIHWKSEQLKSISLLYLAGWSALTCYIFLPQMHERYDYLALIILISYFMVFRRKMLFPAIVMVMCTIVNYCMFLRNLCGFSSPEAASMIAVICYNIAYIYITFDLFRCFSQKN